MSRSSKPETGRKSHRNLSNQMLRSSISRSTKKFILYAVSQRCTMSRKGKKKKKDDS